MDNSSLDFQLAEFLPYRLAVVAEHLSLGMSRRYRADYDISIAEWRVLVNVADRGAVSVRDIEREVHLEKSKASRAASKLEARGLVTKETNTDDRRLVVLMLTDAGRDLMIELKRIASEYQTRLETLLAEDLTGLNTAIDKLLAEDF
ncbi:MarR family transcriptional regulator [Phaeobacter sp. J2-8]|uniref:MarR family winged helix-turn-helix transcriptional regulator n=1 Tax=Phaeobacter sp. J2-8 TaxID=2931394 RepID=UPI001FD21D56|nr:MarR family transcriptional regulator [Phaeobacter sp. J2-8]MCJ7874413.1 MarR family transcriptional regulator [Phaeobacter sp. J2-8]